MIPRVLTELKKLQWIDFRDLRYKDEQSEPVQIMIDQLASSVSKLLRIRVASPPTAEEREAAERQRIWAEEAAAARRDRENAAAAEAKAKREAEEKRKTEDRAAAEKAERERLAREAAARAQAQATARKAEEEEQNGRRIAEKRMVRI